MLVDFSLYALISSPEPKAHRWAYRILMVRRPSVIRRRPSSLTISNIFSSATAWPIKFTWPRWLPHPYMIKHFKNLLLQNWRTDFHETWYVASGTPAHHSLFKWWPWSDLDLFYGMVKFGNFGFSIERSENCWFFRLFAACDLKPT